MSTATTLTETAPPTPPTPATAALATASAALATLRTMAASAADESAELRVTLGVLRTRLDAAEFDAALGDAEAAGRRAALHEQLTTTEAQLVAAGRRAAEADKRAPAARAAVRDAADAAARAQLAEIEAALAAELAAILTMRPVDVTDEALERVGQLARQSYTLRHDLGPLTGQASLARPWDFAKRLGPTLARRLPWARLPQRAQARAAAALGANPARVARRRGGLTWSVPKACRSDNAARSRRPARCSCRRSMRVATP